MTRLVILLALLGVHFAAGRRPKPAPAVRDSHPAPPSWTVMPLNSPQAIRGPKAKLLPFPARGRRLKELLRRYRVAWAGLQEVGPRYSAAFRAGKRFSLYLADPNNKIGSFEVGNGCVEDREQLKRLHRRTARIRRRDGSRRWVRGTLNLPVMLYKDTSTGDRVIFIAGHADRKRPDPAANLSVLRQVAELAAALHHATGVAVVVGMDTNNEAAREIFRAAGLVQLASSGIDKVFGIGCTGHNERILRGFDGEVTDHDDPPAVDVSPVVRDFDRDKLPRLDRLTLAA